MRKEGLVLTAILLVGVLVSGIIFYDDVFNDEVSLSPSACRYYAGDDFRDDCYDDIYELEDLDDLPSECEAYACALFKTVDSGRAGEASVGKQCMKRSDLEVSDLGEFCGEEVKEEAPSSLGSPIRMFVTERTFLPSELRNKELVDGYCNSDVNHPGDSANFLALIGRNNFEVGDYDWILGENREYADLNGSTIGYTSERAWFDDGFEKSFYDGQSGQAWTGLNYKGKAVNNCYDWRTNYWDMERL